MNVLIAERRAGVYVADIVHLGAGSGSLLAAAGALDPLEPYMVLPKFWIRQNGLKGDTISPTKRESIF